MHKLYDENGNLIPHGAHEEKHHHHEGEEKKDENLILLTYMHQHNEQHTAELCIFCVYSVCFPPKILKALPNFDIILLTDRKWAACSALSIYGVGTDEGAVYSSQT